MPQIEDQSSTIVDAVKGQARSIADLTKTVSRGVPAMRDASENVLELNPSSTAPLLTSQANDVGTTFADGYLWVVDKAGQEPRGMVTSEFWVTPDSSASPDARYPGYILSNGSYVGTTAHFTGVGRFDGGIASDNTIAAANFWTGNNYFGPEGLSVGLAGMDSQSVWTDNGETFLSRHVCRAADVYADRVHVGNTYVDGGGVAAGNFGSGGANHNANGFGIGNCYMDFNWVAGAAGNFGGITLGGGGMNTGNRLIDAFFAPIYAGAFFQNISEARFKRDITPIAESQLDVVRGAPVYHYRYRDDAPVASSLAHDGDEEAAAAAAEQWRRGPMADDLPDHLLGDTPRGRAPEMGAMLNTAWAAIAELSAKLDDALGRIAALEAA